MGVGVWKGSWKVLLVMDVLVIFRTGSMVDWSWRYREENPIPLSSLSPIVHISLCPPMFQDIRTRY